MKLLARPEYLSDAIAWLTNFNRLLGLRLFEYPRDHPRPLFSLFYLLIICFIQTASLPYQIIAFYAEQRLLKLEYVLYQLLTYMIASSTFCKLFLGWYYTKSFTSCCRRISLIDETLRQLGSTITYKREQLIAIGIVLSWLLVNIVTSSIVFMYLRCLRQSYLYIWFIILSYSYGFTVNIIVIAEFYVFVSCLKNRFRLVNHLLQLIMPPTNVKDANQSEVQRSEMQRSEMPRNTKQQRHIFSSKLLAQLYQQSCKAAPVTRKKRVAQAQSQVPFQLEKRFQEEIRNCKTPESQQPVMMDINKCKYRLQTIKQVHLELSKVSKTLCNIFGVQIACEIGMSIMFITALCYNLYIRYVLSVAVRDLMQQTIITIILMLINVLKFILISFACENAADEGNKATEIVHMIYGCITNAEIQEEAQQFGIQILQSPIEFTAFGITLNNMVLTTALRSVTTYLVIMIQMSDSLESDNAIPYSKFF